MLFKKMLRDIRKHKTQFISIFLMAFLGVFVFSGVGGESVGLEVNVNDFYNDTNLADGWIYLKMREYLDFCKVEDES